MLFVEEGVRGVFFFSTGAIYLLGMVPVVIVSPISKLKGNIAST